MSWAQKYFAEQLEGLEAESEGHSVKITKLDECEGDVDLNQRKGKIITIYDVALKLSWTGRKPTIATRVKPYTSWLTDCDTGQLADGTKVKGKLSVPEVAHDSSDSDYSVCAYQTD